MSNMNHFGKIAAILNKYEMDAVMLSCEANRFYASDYFSTGSDGIALITKNANYYLTDFRYIEAAQNKIENADVIMVDSVNTYSKCINDIFEKHNIKTVGFDDEYMTVGEFSRFNKKLKWSPKPASAMLSSVRQTKDDDEISRMIKAQRIAEKALEEIKNDIKVGVSEKTIAARLLYLMLINGAEDKSFDPIVVSGKNSSMPHGVPTEKKIEAGDFVTLDFGCKYMGYCSDMTRTFAVGYASDEMTDIYNTVLTAQKQGIAAVKAGVTGKDADNAARKVIADAGFGECFGHSFGHGVGVEIHESPNLSPSNNKALPVGAVVSAEPGIYIPGKFGVRIEDVLIVKENGCDDITLADKNLTIL